MRAEKGLQSRPEVLAAHLRQLSGAPEGLGSSTLPGEEETVEECDSFL
jgi:hypothetical protein